MFRCQLCSCVVLPRTPVQQLVLEKRPRQYAFRARANRALMRNGKKVVPDDPGGSGFEIARVVHVCPECARKNGAM
jgi:hypothetical protein